MSILTFLSLCNRYVFAPAMPVLLFFAGLYLLFMTKGYPFRSPRHLLFILKKPSTDGVSPFRAMTLALAGTLGVGNIAGVASAIACGGAGAVFWMTVSAFFAMTVKYAEIVLAIRHRKIKADGTAIGGAMYYFPTKALSVLFAVLCTLSSFFIGNIIQVKAASEAMQEAAGIPPVIIGILLALGLFAVLGGGFRRISDLTVRLIPFLCLTYLCFCLTVLVLRFDALPDTVYRIFSEAFTVRSVGGGLLGSGIAAFFTMPALRYGVTRGLLSNEAGCGTAPMAHAGAHTDSPAEQGCWGIFEVFCDTVLLCSVTALVILSSGVDTANAKSGMDLAIRAFTAVLGKGAGVILAVSVILFAFASAVCWGYYGEQGLSYLSVKRTPKTAYIILYSACAVYGALAEADATWVLADFAVGSMTLLNTVCVCLNSDEIKKDTLAVFSRKRKIREKPKSRPLSVNQNRDVPISQNRDTSVN